MEIKKKQVSRHIKKKKKKEWVPACRRALAEDQKTPGVSIAENTYKHILVLRNGS